MWKEVKKIIRHHKNFLLTTHENPDGDGVGSACALIEMLLHFGKQVRFVVDSPISHRLRFLDKHGLFTEYNEHMDLQHAEVLIVLDTHRLNRIGRLSHLLNQPDLKAICIDHHLPTSTFTPYTVIDTRVCSVGAMIYSLFQDMGFSLNFNAAMGLYTSIITDTGRFSYSSTNRDSHKLAEECIKHGVDPEEMHKKIFQQIPVDALNLFASAFAHCRLYFNNRFLLQELRIGDFAASKVDPNDMDYLLEISKSFQGLNCIALLRELPGHKVRISLRSNDPNVDVEPIVKALGGGGHSKAAGATIDGTLDSVKDSLLKMVENHLFLQSKD